MRISFLSLHNNFTVNLSLISSLMQTVLFSQKFFHFQNLSITPDSCLLYTSTQQQDNSKTAIASGELTGKRLSGDSVASVNEGNFVAENQTDFIFAVAGEEYGFIGCTTIILLLLAIALECIRMGLRAKDLSGKIICCGMGSIVAFQSFLNICVATGMGPNTGTPLPFVSYGLTSLISLYIGMGLVLNVGLQSSLYNKELQKTMSDKKEEYL